MIKKHSVSWIQELESSLDNFENEDDKLKFLSDQYFRLTLLIMALDGEIQFVGMPVDFN